MAWIDPTLWTWIFFLSEWAIRLTMLVVVPFRRTPAAERGPRAQSTSPSCAAGTPLNHGLRQHEHRRAGVNHSWDRLVAHLIRLQEATAHQGQVMVIRKLNVNAESAHAVGSFGSHGFLLPRLDECL